MKVSQENKAVQGVQLHREEMQPGVMLRAFETPASGGNPPPPAPPPVYHGSFERIARKCAACAATEKQSAEPEPETSGAELQRMPLNAAASPPPPPPSLLAGAGNQMPAAESRAHVQHSPFNLGPVVQRFAGMDYVARKCAACEEKEGKAQRKRIYAKLEVGAADDPMEKEADAMADHVVRRSSFDLGPQIQRFSAFDFVARKCAACEAEKIHRSPQPTEEAETETLQRSPDGSLTASEDVSARIEGRKGYGAALSGGLKSQMESGFGTDFSQVRLHTDSHAVQLSRDLNAKAFTVGNDVFFNSGTYDPASQSGQHLIAHELTHVVQQGGGGWRAVQRWTGTDVHQGLQNRLRAVNDDLITEAPIPGAIEDGIGLGVMGYADLYKSKGHTISGVKEKKSKVTGTIEYKPLDQSDYNGKKHQTQSKAPWSFSPMLSGSAFSGEFTPSFEIADIKPSDHAHIFGGVDNTGRIKKGSIQQVDQYITGHEEFVDRAITNKKVTNQTKGSYMGALNIPDEINYDKFEQEKNNHTDKKRFVFPEGNEETRIWVSYKPNSATMLYINLPNPYTNSPKNKKIREAYEALSNSVLPHLTTRSTRPVTRLKPAGKLPIQEKSSAKGKDADSKDKKANRKKIQRKTNWKAAEKAFDQNLATWSKQYGTPIEKDKYYDKSIDRRRNFDKEIGKSSAEPQEFKELNKEFRKVEFWAGDSGKTLGKIRFKLGPLFDDVSERFEKIREKTKNVKKNISGPKVDDAKGFEEWKKTLLRLLTKTFKETLIVILEEGYRVLSTCFAGIIDHFEQQMLDGSEWDDAFWGYMETFHEKIAAFEKKLHDDYGALMAEYEGYLKLLSDINYYTSMLGDAISLIRIGVQVVSCLSPPALGCLWGLVAQIGIEAGLNLIVGSDWFVEKIIRPNVRSMLGDFIKKTTLDVLNGILTAVGLDKYTEGVAACQVSNETFDGALGSAGGKGIPLKEYKSFVTQFEKENEGMLVKDILDVLKDENGVPLTAERLKNLLAQIQEKNITMEQLKEAVENAKIGSQFSLPQIETKLGIENKTDQKSETAPGDGQTQDKSDKKADGGPGTGEGDQTKPKNEIVRHGFIGMEDARQGSPASGTIQKAFMTPPKTGKKGEEVVLRISYTDKGVTIISSNIPGKIQSVETSDNRKKYKVELYNGCEFISKEHNIHAWLDPGRVVTVY